jgi:hypothetical protein
MRIPTLFARTTKTEDGLSFPAAAYAYVPDPQKPSTWKIRLWETPDKKETPGQVGRAAAALSKGGFRGNPADLPASDLAAVKRKVRAAWKRQNPGKADADMPEGIRMSASFAVEDPDTHMVHHWGKLFEVGSWPDKGFSLDADEMAAAVAAFQPVPIDIEHRPSKLDGKLGYLEQVELTDDGQELYGMWAMPAWLDQALGDEERTVSTHWDPPTKRLIGLALVRNPRIEDAVLMAAFSNAAVADLPAPPATFSDLSTAATQGEWPTVLAALLRETTAEGREHVLAFATEPKRHDTRTGQQAIQEIHNTSARYGAVCAAPMASQHEADAMQQIHDLTAQHGATCEDMSNRSSPWYYSADPVVQPARPAEGASDLNLQQFLARMGLTEPTPEITAMFAEGAPNPPQPTPQPQPAPTPATATMSHESQEEIARLRAENRRLTVERIQHRATTYVNDQVREGRVMPAEREALIATYCQALLDDAALPGVTMSDGSTSNRVALLEAQVAARPKHQLDIEALPADIYKTLQTFSHTPTDQTRAGTDKDTIDGLMAKTPLGKQVIADRNGASK